MKENALHIGTHHKKYLVILNFPRKQSSLDLLGKTKMSLLNSKMRDITVGCQEKKIFQNDFEVLLLSGAFFISFYINCQSYAN